MSTARPYGWSYLQRKRLRAFVGKFGGCGIWGSYVLILTSSFAKQCSGIELSPPPPHTHTKYHNCTQKATNNDRHMQTWTEPTRHLTLLNDCLHGVCCSALRSHVYRVVTEVAFNTRLASPAHLMTRNSDY